MKKIKFLLLMILGVGILATSCDDDFSEEDLLNAQNDLVNSRQDSIKADNIDALNAAGEMVGFQLKVVDTDGIGIEGLSVSLTASIGSGDFDEQTATTNANGVALFDRVAVGGNIANISGGSIIPITLDVDFGNIMEGKHYKVVDNVIIPTPVTESAIVTALGATASTATVQGNVKIETDLTNLTSEIPQDVSIKANFNDNLASESSSISIGYFLATNEDKAIGTAVVDNTTGAYSMTVPAGVSFNLEIPNLTATQTIAIGGIDGIELDRPEYRDVPANFGPAYSNPTNIPSVNGARVVFDEPNAAGSGFAINGFTRVPRDGDDVLSPVPTVRRNRGNEIWRFTSLGSGYIASPTVTITDATATNKYAEAHIKLAITGASVEEEGTGYAASTSYTFNLIYDETFDNGDGTVGTNADKTQANFVLDVQTDATGVFTQDSVTAAIAVALDNQNTYFDESSLVTILDNAKNLRLVNTSGGNGDAVLAVTSAKSRVENLQYTGDDFTNPTFSFTGGGGITQAAATVEWASRWTFNLDNTNTEAYGSLPEVNFEYSDVSVNPSQKTSAIVNIYDLEGHFQTTADIKDRLMVSSNGNIVYQDASENNRTRFYSVEAPTAIIEDPSNGTVAKARAKISDDGNITSLIVIDSGSGYLEPFNATIEPSIEGAPGTGATVKLTGGRENTNGVFTWSRNYTITNHGSGYVLNLNQIDPRGYSDSNPGTYYKLDQGDVRIIDIDYGTGNRTTNYEPFYY
jgi:hypothetical protein